MNRHLGRKGLRWTLSAYFLKDGLAISGHKRWDGLGISTNAIYIYIFFYVFFFISLISYIFQNIIWKHFPTDSSVSIVPSTVAGTLQARGAHLSAGMKEGTVARALGKQASCLHTCAASARARTCLPADIPCVCTELEYLGEAGSGGFMSLLDRWWN